MKAVSTSAVPALDPTGRLLARISSRSALATDFAMLMERVPEYRAASFRAAVIDDNILARTSGSARAKLFQELKGRYLLDLDSPLFAAFLAEWRAHPNSHDRQLLAYTLFNLNDRTAYVTTRDWLFPRLRQASSELRIGDLMVFFQSIGRNDHPEVAEWTPITLTRVAQHYLASVRDFGLATGGTRKIAVRPSLQPGPIRLLIRALMLIGVPSSDIIRHDAFKILGIAPSEVVDMLSELNRHQSLRFRMQADVIELSL
jgi:hypothetical protein